MRFCPKCESMLVLVTERGKSFFQCGKCGYKEGAAGEERLERRSGESVIVIEREKDVRTMSEVSAECPKCGNRKAVWWTVQTR
ncbi:MAG: transcription factor S, partial [Candidatus Bathyarchaeia archaeon]